MHGRFVKLGPSYRARLKRRMRAKTLKSLMRARLVGPLGFVFLGNKAVRTADIFDITLHLAHTGLERLKQRHFLIPAHNDDPALHILLQQADIGRDITLELVNCGVNKRAVLIFHETILGIFSYFVKLQPCAFRLAGLKIALIMK